MRSEIAAAQHIQPSSRGASRSDASRRMATKGKADCSPPCPADVAAQPLVRHVHRAPGGRNRAAGPDVFRKLDFSGPDPALGIQIDPDTQGRQRSGGGFLHGGRALSGPPSTLPPERFANKMNSLDIDLTSQKLSGQA